MKRTKSFGAAIARRSVVALVLVGSVVPGAGAGRPAITASAAETYVVKPGDTLRTIAERYDVSLQDVIKANALAEPDALQVGQTLTIPTGGGAVSAPAAAPTVSPPAAPPAAPAVTSGGTVTVQAGQTLVGIAQANGTTVAAIVDANGLTNANLIQPGQVLVIPGGRTPVQPSSRGASAPAPVPPAAPPSAPAAVPVAAPAATPVPARAAGPTRVFAVTMYCLPGRTATGEGVRLGGVSADWSVLRPGTRIRIEGLGDFTVNDHYDYDLGRQRLDVWEPSCARARQWGVRNLSVTVLD